MDFDKRSRNYEEAEGHPTEGHDEPDRSDFFYIVAPYSFPQSDTQTYRLMNSHIHTHTHSPTTLSDLREKISELRAVPCRMKHEKVVETIPSNTVITADGEEITLPVVHERLGFCPKEFRDRQIACGHTTSRYILREALEELQQIHPSPEAIRDMLNEWHRLDGEIGLLDHRKGEAERVRAELTNASQLPGGMERQRTEATRELEDIHRNHGLCVERLNRLQERTLQELDRVIGQFGRNTRGSAVS